MRESYRDREEERELTRARESERHRKKERERDKGWGGSRNKFERKHHTLNYSKFTIKYLKITIN